MVKKLLFLVLIFGLGACNLEQAEKMSEDVNNTNNQYNENNFMPDYGTWRENQTAEDETNNWDEVEDYPYHLPHCDDDDHDDEDDQVKYLSFYGRSAEQTKVKKYGGEEVCIIDQNYVEREELENDDHKFNCDHDDEEDDD
jgi:hypothetical protein